MIERICYVCRERFERAGLIRVFRVKNPDGSYKYGIDEIGNANGRGAHICRECIPKAKKTRALNRSFKANVPQSIYDDLGK